jgi:hypothetical protein
MHWLQREVVLSAAAATTYANCMPSRFISVIHLASVKEVAERLPDVYFSQDYPVLLEIAKAELNATAQAMPPQPERLAELLGRPLLEVCASGARLRQAGLILGDPVNAGIKDSLPASLNIRRQGVRDLIVTGSANLRQLLEKFVPHIVIFEVVTLGSWPLAAALAKAA